MKRFLEKLNVEFFMAIGFLITAIIIFLTNGQTYSLEYTLNIILGFVFAGFGVIRNDIKEIKQKLEGKINE